MTILIGHFGTSSCKSEQVWASLCKSRHVCLTKQLNGPSKRHWQKVDCSTARAMLAVKNGLYRWHQQYIFSIYYIQLSPPYALLNSTWDLFLWCGNKMRCISMQVILVLVYEFYPQSEKAFILTSLHLIYKLYHISIH